MVFEKHNTEYGSGDLGVADDVLWTSYNGSLAIVRDVLPGQTAGIYADGHYTPIRWPADVVDAAW
jgi:hypothetical protein